MKHALFTLTVVVVFMPVFVYADYTIDLGEVNGDAGGWGATFRPEAAQTFTTVGAGDLVSFGVSFYTSNGASDDPVFRIRTASGDEPTGSDLAVKTYTGSVGTAACAITTITLDTPLPVSAATEYAIIFDRSGADSDTEFYSTCQDTDNVYAGGLWTEYDGATWTPRNGGANDALRDIFISTEPATTTPTGGATSTVEQTQQNLFYGYALFLLSMVIMMWIIRKH